MGRTGGTNDFLSTLSYRPNCARTRRSFRTDLIMIYKNFDEKDMERLSEQQKTEISDITINPITRLDYPDPDVIRVSDIYYMVSTTMHFMPGGEILRSYDLVNWEHAAFVYDHLDSTPGQRLEGAQNIYGKGMWAASLRFNRGVFYVCFVANDTGKTYLYTSESIAGPWKKQQIAGFTMTAPFCLTGMMCILHTEIRTFISHSSMRI